MTNPAETTPEPLEDPAEASHGGYTVRVAARALGVTREHLYALIRQGDVRAIDGPGAKGQGTVRLVPVVELERLIAERGARAHGEVKPGPADDRPLLLLERVTQRLEGTRAVLGDALEVIGEPVAGGWWGRRGRERERMARLEAALRAAAAVAGGPEATPSPAVPTK